jgi:hypothetical protein
MEHWLGRKHILKEAAQPNVVLSLGDVYYDNTSSEEGFVSARDLGQ